MSTIDELRNLRSDNAQLNYALKQSEQCYLELRAENEALRKLAMELRGAAKCYNLHHCKAKQHGISEPCKVLARIDSAMSK